MKEGNQIPQNDSSGILPDGLFTGDATPSETTIKEVHPYKLSFECPNITYHILGALPLHNIGAMQVTILARDNHSLKKERAKADLYVYEDVSALSRQLAISFGCEEGDVLSDIRLLTDQLESYIDARLTQDAFHGQQVPTLLPQDRKKAIEFLAAHGLSDSLQKLLAQSGLPDTAESLLLFLAATSYAQEYPLYTFLHSSPLVAHYAHSIAACLPPEVVISISRMNAKKLSLLLAKEACGRLLWASADTLNKEAVSILSEGQSCTPNGRDKTPFALLLYSSRPPAKETSDTFLNIPVLGKEIETSLLQQQYKAVAGRQPYDAQEENRLFLHQLCRCLNNEPVHNPFVLPADAFTIPPAFLLQMYKLTRHVTLWHQHQRERNDNGAILTQKEDVLLAAQLIAPLLHTGADPLKPDTLRFFERLKSLLQPKGEQKTFTARDIQTAFFTSRTQTFRYLKELESEGLIKKAGGQKNKGGFSYKITQWEDEGQTARHSFLQSIERCLNEIQP